MIRGVLLILAVIFIGLFTCGSMATGGGDYIEPKHGFDDLPDDYCKWCFLSFSSCNCIPIYVEIIVTYVNAVVCR